MQDQEYFRIGTLVKTHGVHGELILEALNPEIIENIKESVLLELEGLLVPFFIHEMVPTSRERFRIQFDWVTTEKKAKTLVSAPVFLETHRVEISDEILQDSPELLIGYQVYDEVLGLLGKVEAFIDNPSNPLLEILHPKGELLIPFQAEFFLSINAKAKKIKVNLPEGLVDLYL